MRIAWAVRSPEHGITWSENAPAEERLVGMATAIQDEPPEFHQAPGTPMTASELTSVAKFLTALAKKPPLSR